MLISLLLFTLTEYDLLQKATAEGFLYRNVAIETTEKCPDKDFCAIVDGARYHFKRLDATAVTLEKSADGFTLTISPDKNFTNYRLFIREGLTARRIEATQKRIAVIDKGALTALQLVGVGARGPVVIWQKDIRPAAVEPFTGDLLGSMNALRKKAGLPPLALDKALAPAADNAMKRMKNGELAHYSGDEGSVKHAGVRAGSLGENLFTATGVEKAWLMMTASPSHLFNIVSPAFRRCWVENKNAADGSVTGVVIFAD